VASALRPLLHKPNSTPNSKPNSSSAYTQPIYINASDLAAAAGLHYYMHRNHIKAKSFK
jgi:hypothetical protein